MSVIVALVSDTSHGRCNPLHLERCLAALEAQEAAPPMEVIVPYHAQVEGIDRLRDLFPTVTFLECTDRLVNIPQGGSREHHDELRAFGVDAAQGDLIALLEDHAQPAPGWAAAMARAHEQPYAGVGGAIENGIDRSLNWAVYFCDFGRYQNPVPSTDSAIASDANVAYKRVALAAVRKHWANSFSETAVNWALRQRGERLMLSSEAIVYQQRSDLKHWFALKERFVWGRSFAALRSRSLSRQSRLLYAAASPLLPLVLLSRMTKLTVARRRRLVPFFRAFPVTSALTAAWACGEFIGYLAKPHRPERKHIGAGAMARDGEPIPT
jgi:hypothetical protein